MSTFGETLGAGGFGNIGQGFSQKPGQQDNIVELPAFEEFYGIDLQENPLKVSPGAGQRGTLDMEVSFDKRLVRSPGIRQIEDQGARRMKYAFVHANTDATGDLVFIDPPWIGVRHNGVTTWTNAAISTTGTYDWTAANFGGQLLLTNGSVNGYARAFGATSLTSLTSMPAGRTLAVAFARAFVGSPIISGVMQPLGVAWNAASGLYNDWTGTGSGVTFLITDMPDVDRVVALRPIGYAQLGILTRYNLWLGLPTGDANQPIDPRLQIPQVGCVSERTARASRDGIIFLSDDGVRLFDGNNAPILSGPVNPMMLPLNMAAAHLFSAMYDARTHRYILALDTGTYVYEFPLPELQRPARWYFRSAVLNNVVSFTEPSGLPAIDNAPTPYFMKDGLLGVEDIATFNNFTTALLPKWVSPVLARQDITQQVTTLAFDLQYEGFGPIRLSTANTSGVMRAIRTRTLPDTGSSLSQRRVWHKPQTGLNAGMAIEILGGYPKISSIRQIVKPAGPSRRTV